MRRSSLQSRTTIEYFDHELFWKTFKFTCRYAQGLNLHNLDGNASSAVGSIIKDGDRKSLWMLIQIDLFFRLLCDTPPETATGPGAVSTSCFIVSSRITLILAQFFQLVDSPAAAMDHPESWQLDDWIKRRSDDVNLVWALSDVLITGYMGIIFMLRKVAALRAGVPTPIQCDADLPDYPVVRRVSRAVLHIADAVLEHHPYPSIVAMLFGACQANIPCAFLLRDALGDQGGSAKNDVSTTNLADREADLALVSRVARHLAVVSKTETDFAPLTVALDSLCEEAARQIERERGVI
ncbi:unnamed protein product [Parascedosporium putredinis]|uniref:Uncharacterized protein n=1 Tax=Parascedosporium putredinis TaxID=1442378 RepID=A0A9P1M972_9PEZI|nr:unnamed protein product [Parascedosporium putredinis]CAI7994103.1 unnamed protein product [Parascedosporium putredinis]